MTVARILNIPEKQRLYMRFVPDGDMFQSQFIPVLAGDPIQYIRKLAIHNVRRIYCKKWTDVFLTEAGKKEAIFSCVCWERESDKLTEWMM